MPLERISTDQAPGAIGPYSQAIRRGNWLFLSGQIPLDPASMTVISGDIRVQTERVIQNLTAVLEAAGASLQHVVKTTVYLRDMNDFAAMNETYASFFTGDTPPARAAVEVARLPKDVDVEIDAVAFTGD